MGLYSGSFLVDLFGVFVTLFCGVYIYFQYKFRYWERRNVPYLKPEFPFGNEKDLFLLRKGLGEMITDHYKQLKAPGRRFGGVYSFSKPAVVLLDPEIIKDVLSKDFDYFVDRPLYLNEEKEPLTANLLFLQGHKWKTAREKLSPTFTSGKIKTMFHTMLKCGDAFESILDGYAMNGTPLDIKDLMARYTTDIISNCAFGTECNSLVNPKEMFRQLGKKFVKPTSWESLKHMFAFQYPKLFASLGLTFIPGGLNEFFKTLVTDTVEYREKNNVKRNDFMQILMQLGKNNNDINGHKETETAFSIKEMSAHAAVFFLGGFDTSSTNLMFTCYELALNQEIQDKVRQEINEMYKEYDGNITYESVMEMEYMNKVFNESLRLHTVFPRVVRVCTKDYQVRNSDVTFETGTFLTIPICAIQNDPEYFPEPEKFDPERFSSEGKKKMKSFTFMPFGEGPRHCIGSRFAQVQSKLALTIVLRKFRFKLSPKTRIPLQFVSKVFATSVKGDIWLEVEKVA